MSMGILEIAIQKDFKGGPNGSKGGPGGFKGKLKGRIKNEQKIFCQTTGKCGKISLRRLLMTYLSFSLPLEQKLESFVLKLHWNLVIMPRFKLNVAFEGSFCPSRCPWNWNRPLISKINSNFQQICFKQLEMSQDSPLGGILQLSRNFLSICRENWPKNLPEMTHADAFGLEN